MSKIHSANLGIFDSRIESYLLFARQASYALGLLLFPNDPALQLGLFFTGVSPAGGASNTWTVILGGNIDLSITMSTTSTLASFGEH